MKTYIIAEAGVNHNGSFDMAMQLIDKAKEAGVDCVKFQTFHAEALVSRQAKKAAYQVANTKSDDSQFAMLKQLELTEEQFVRLKAHCDEIGIDFLSTAFDMESIRFLHRLGCSCWKIPSGEITNLPYLLAVAEYGQPVIMSTGMATMAEVEAAVNALRQAGCMEITLLHCTTEYPAPVDQVNLAAMQTMRDHFGVAVGYSDHTAGIEIPVAAVALGATVLEKHFTLDRDLPGPDHKASLEPGELAAMTRAIRCVESAIGSGIKEPGQNERGNIAVARRSIVAKTSVRQGEILTPDNITVKRPGTGISPMKWFDVLGTAAVKDYEPDEMIVL